MKSEKIQTFTERYPLVGPFFWIVSIQLFIAQLVVGMAWAVHYSLTQNTISDLGNSACGLYDSRYVCSPLNAWMNFSFIVLGLTMVTGSVLIYHEFKKSRYNALGFGLMALSGIGTLLVGLFPENTVSLAHVLGAGLTFGLGNLALLVLGYSLDIPYRLRLYTLISGGLSLSALILFLSHKYLGLGIGGMERLVAHPQTIWLIVFGVYISSNRFRN